MRGFLLRGVHRSVPVCFLAGNEFPFFRLYYCTFLICAILISFLNGVLLLPIVLSVIGVKAFPREEAGW